MPTAAQEDGVHRLSDIIVEEVSLVDRAANKRRFLLVKREGGDENMNELRADGRGGFTRVSKTDGGETADTEKKTDATETDKKAPPFPPKPAEGSSGAGGSSGAKDPEDDDETKAKKSVAETAALADEVVKSANALVIAATAMKGSLDVAKSELPEGITKNFAEANAALAVAVSKLLGAPIAKAGRKMASRRLEVLRNASDMIGTLIAELDPPAAADTETTKATELAKAATVKLAEATEIVKSTLASKVALEKELATLKKSVKPGNSVPVEHATNVKKNETTVTWPSNLNHRSQRELTAKADFGAED